jgi:hypothetical protein
VVAAGGSGTAAAPWRHRGGSVAAVVAVAAAVWRWGQRGGGGGSMAVAAAVAAAWWRWWQLGGSLVAAWRQVGSSAMAVAA